MYCVANVKVTNAVTTINGISGTANIANMWMQHFEDVYNKLDDNVGKSKFSELLNDTHKDKWIVTINDVVNSIRKPKKSKAVGPDGLAIWKFSYMARLAY